MRLLVDLIAQADAAPDPTYHDKLRGRLGRALQGTKFEGEHDNNEPLGLAYSNIFPWGEMKEGDERQLLLASPREELLATIAENFRDDREFNVGDRPFEIADQRVVNVDVGEPTTEGTLKTDTGVVVRLYEHHRQEFGIEGDYGDTPTYWRSEHSLQPFRQAITDNLQQKHDLFEPEYLPGPNEVDGQLFTDYELIKTYSLPVTVTTGVERQLILSKWELGYRVRDDDHRRHLNLALDTGIGGRNGLGFGFVNRRLDDDD